LLVILRHGKAEPYGREDHGRRLIPRGERDAADVGSWLVSHGFAPTHAIVSSAIRTQMTWDRVAAGGDLSLSPEISDVAYGVGPESALDLFRAVPADTEVLLFLGHNPTVSSLVHLLDDGEPDPSAFRALTQGLPTCGTAVLEVGVPWADLDAATARLVAFHVGHG
jgi:phosphohistidine phosphatase